MADPSSTPGLQLRLNVHSVHVYLKSRPLGRASAGASSPRGVLPGIRAYSLADYWLTSVLTGIRALPGRYPRHAAARILNPLSYPRMMEYTLLHELLGSLAQKRVLDIGSPKLPALLIARSRNVELHATDVRDYFIQPTAHFLRRIGLGDRIGSGVRLGTADARALSFGDEEFDAVYSVSVFEHIADGGDALAAAEVARVLKPGGRLCLTVPFDLSGYREEWVRGDVFERSFADDAVFYQRHYDCQALQARIVGPSALQLERVEFFGEPGYRFEPRWNRIPIKWKVPLLWAQPFLARFLMKRLPPDRADRACGVALLLRKPDR